MTEFAAEEFYPMPLFVRLEVRDVAASADWYEKALGFRSVYALPASGTAQAMNHLRLERYQDLMLVVDPADSAGWDKGRGLVINFAYTGDLEALARRARATGATVEGPAPTPWNTRQVAVQDPDGFVLAFSQILDASRSFEDVMAGSGHDGRQ